MKRRSFLSAVLGAVAAPLVARSFPSKQAEALARFDLAWKNLQEKCEYLNWIVWDSVCVIPDTVIDDTLFPSPCPTEFILSGIGIHFLADSDVASMTHALKDLRMTLAANGMELMDSPLYVLPHERVMRLVQPVIVTSGMRLKVHSDGKATRNHERVTFNVILQGCIRRALVA